MKNIMSLIFIFLAVLHFFSEIGWWYILIDISMSYLFYDKQ